MSTPVSFTPRSELSRSSCLNMYLRSKVPWASYLDHMQHFHGKRTCHIDLVKVKLADETLQSMYEHMQTPDSHVILMHRECACTAGQVQRVSQLNHMKQFKA